MLFLFHVDTGKMITFDVSLALENVEDFQVHVEKETKIPVHKQVLLISGGECLDPKRNVCSYPAGTDTNPIYLFSKSVIESTTAPTPTADYGSEDQELKERLKEASELPVSINTVVKRAQLAQQFHEVAKELIRICEKLVHDQHLQHQGWSAVVANLDDITVDLAKRASIFDKNVDEYMSERDSYLTFLKHFNEDLIVLQKIPVLSTLLENEAKNEAELESSKSESVENTTEETSTSENRSTSLFQWISAADNSSSVDQLYEQCCRGLEQFDEKIFEGVREEVREILQNADLPEMKEVKGLGERLSGLENLMREAKKKVQEQADLAQAFLKNQTRAANIKDTSILPDLCASHRKQLHVIATNHQQLGDIRRRCTKAKDELSQNLYHRLKWVMFIENHIQEIDQKMVIYNENLRRLRRHIEVLQQIHLAPAIYLCAVTEVVRRTTFSQSYLMWATELACHLLTIHNDEVSRRKDFLSQFTGHFLNSLFPGMDDVPPAFATQPPPVFDDKLPKITEEDLERLKSELPEFADHLNVPDTSGITHFFTIKSMMQTEKDKTDDSKAVEEKLVEAVNAVGLASELDQNMLKATGSEPCLTTAQGVPHLKDLDRGCESETDTEEFEKVGQSPLELHFDKEIPSPRPRTNDAATLTEDNLQISRSEHEKLRSLLARMGYLAKQATIQLSSELNQLKSQFTTNRSTLEENYRDFIASFKESLTQRDNEEKRVIEEMKKCYQFQIEEIRNEIIMKDVEISRLKSTNETVQSDLQKSSQQIVDIQEEMKTVKEQCAKQLDQLQDQLVERDVESEKVIKELTDRLNREHKAEVENLRSRFKLMTMERSPSDTSLEKIGDFSSIPNHEMILVQITENFELDKEKAVTEAISKESEKWQKVLEERVAEMNEKFDADKEAFAEGLRKEICSSKDKQINVLREREKNLNLECLKYKGTIQQLAESETNNNSAELLEKIGRLEKEKQDLEEELERVNEKVSAVECEEKTDACTSPIKQIEPMARSEITVVKSGKLNIESCRAGDQVLVLWDSTHESFKILQESRHMFFLHSDYLEVLNLEVVNGKPNKAYCTAEVIDKEYCHARKSENRYKVPKGTKFFRVKVKPLASSSVHKDLSQSYYQPKSTMLLQSHMSQSQTTVPTYAAVVSSETTPGHSSLPSSPTKLQTAILEKPEELPDSEAVDSENPEELRPSSVEKTFLDSGIVENLEQATAAIESIDRELRAQDNLKDESENSDRCLVPSKQHTFVSSNWLEMMISRVFSKSSDTV